MYSPETAVRYPQYVKKRSYKTGGWMLVIGLIAATLWLRVNGIPDWLIPGDPEVTKEAAEVFMSQMREGVTVNDAVTAFCKTVLSGAGV